MRLLLLEHILLLEKIDTPKPILFHIHGGAYYMFSGGETLYDMTLFADIHYAVGVSINYRLGWPLFLSMLLLIEDNLCLRDQQFSLNCTNMSQVSAVMYPELSYTVVPLVNETYLLKRNYFDVIIHKPFLQLIVKWLESIFASPFKSPLKTRP